MPRTVTIRKKKPVPPSTGKKQRTDRGPVHVPTPPIRTETNPIVTPDFDINMEAPPVFLGTQDVSAPPSVPTRRLSTFQGRTVDITPTGVETITRGDQTRRPKTKTRGSQSDSAQLEMTIGESVNIAPEVRDTVMGPATTSVEVQTDGMIDTVMGPSLADVEVQTVPFGSGTFSQTDDLQQRNFVEEILMNAGSRFGQIDASTTRSAAIGLGGLALAAGLTAGGKLLVDHLRGRYIKSAAEKKKVVDDQKKAEAAKKKAEDAAKKKAEDEKKKAEAEKKKADKK